VAVVDSQKTPERTARTPSYKGWCAGLVGTRSSARASGGVWRGPGDAVVLHRVGAAAPICGDVARGSVPGPASRRPCRAPRSGTSAPPELGLAGGPGDAVVLHREGAAAPIWGDVASGSGIGMASRRPCRAPRSGTSAPPELGLAGGPGDAVVLHREGAAAPICDGHGFLSPVPGSALRDERISRRGIGRRPWRCGGPPPRRRCRADLGRRHQRIRGRHGGCRGHRRRAVSYESSPPKRRAFRRPMRLWPLVYQSGISQKVS